MASGRKHTAILIAMFFLTAALVHLAARHRLSQARVPDWNNVAYQFAGWSGSDAMFDPVYGEDPAQTSLLKVYHHHERSESVIVYVAFYGDLARILEMHTPERCYAGQGWRVESIGDSSPGRFRGESIPAREMLVEKTGKRRLVLWWYMAGARPFRNRIRYVYAMLAMSTLTGRTDGTLVRFESPFEDGQEDVARQRVENFAKDFQTQLDKALPQ
jgi:EpsI family protein